MQLVEKQCLLDKISQSKAGQRLLWHKQKVHLILMAWLLRKQTAIIFFLP